MSEVYGRILWDSAAHQADAIITYSNTPIVGFEPAYAFDYRDFTAFRHVASGDVITITLPSGFPLTNAIAFYVGAGVAGSVAVDAPTGDFDVNVPIGEEAGIYYLNGTGVAIGLGGTITLTFNLPQRDWKQIYVGEEMVFPRGQRDGIAPPTLTGGFKLTNNVAINGSIIGTSVVRQDRKSTIELDYLTETYIRDTWEPFAAEHVALGRPFFYLWNFEGFPLEGTFAAAENLSRPVNMSPHPFMSVSLPLRNLI